MDAYDETDPTSLTLPTRRRIDSMRLMFARHLYNSVMAETRSKRMVRPLRVGVPLEYNVEELSDPVRSAWTELLQQFKAQGHEIVPVSLPTTKQALAAYYVIAPAEASSNLAKYDGVRYGWRAEGPDGASGVLFSKTRGEGFGAEVKRRILLGTFSLSATAMDNYFIQAQRVRRLVQRDFDAVFSFPNVLHNEGAGNVRNDGVDVLVCPTAPHLPPPLQDVQGIDPLREYVGDVLTVPASLAGLPAISVPVDAGAGATAGMQIIGQFGHDDLVLDVAEMVERWKHNYAPQAEKRKQTPKKRPAEEDGEGEPPPNRSLPPRDSALWDDWSPMVGGGRRR